MCSRTPKVWRPWTSCIPAKAAPLTVPSAFWKRNALPVLPVSDASVPAPVEVPLPKNVRTMVPSVFVKAHVWPVSDELSVFDVVERLRLRGRPVRVHGRGERAGRERVGALDGAGRCGGGAAEARAGTGECSERTVVMRPAKVMAH